MKTNFNRRGVVAVESAVVLSLVLLLLFGFVDLSLAVLRSNAIEYSANKIARNYAIAAGLSSDDSPFAISTTADNQRLCQLIANGTPTIPTNQMLVTITESTLSSDTETTVDVDIQFVHKAIVPALLPWNRLPMHSQANQLVLPVDSAR